MNFIRSFPPILIVAALFAVLVCVPARPLRLSDRAGQSVYFGLATNSADRTHEMTAFSDALERTLTHLDAARCELLRKATVQGADRGGLQDAARSYRIAIVRFRRECESLDRELTQQEIEQVVGAMMAHTTSVSKRVLIAELTGDLKLAIQD